jgi:hypothetical protein
MASPSPAAYTGGTLNDSYIDADDLSKAAYALNEEQVIFA